MFPTLTGDGFTVYHGSNLDVLPTLPDNSVDSIVTDPPYELGFMGKSWDSSGIAYSVELWAECMRVLKPGGHLLAFGGSRTWHRLAVAIEDAGFEMRDSIAWLYGSGFPKSMDISKAIDKRGGVDITWFGSWLRSWRKDNGITQKEVASLFPSKSGALTGCVANWELGLNLPTAEQFSLICEHFNLPFESLEEAERKVIGTKQSTLGGTVAAGERNQEYVDLHKNKIVNITAPATPEAVKWQGWGTALKPAFEPVVVARKPFKGTVASNVLEWGVGGLNIDGSRIATDEIITNHSRSAEAAISKGKFGDSVAQETFQTNGQKLGRWPANIILDPYTAELLDEQSEEVSRFFYVAKASKRDRNEGLEELEGKEIGAKGNGLARTCATCNASVLDGCDCPDRTFVNPSRKNFHPTVKPTALMEYLIKLVTPEGGIVLDPFTGSGSTGKAALLNDYQFIGIELTEEYLPIIKGRLEWANKEKKDTIF